MAFDYSEFVNKVMTGLRLSDASSAASDFHSFHAAFQKPFITIARDPGSGGHPIGRLVAEKLGFQFLDDELLEDVAKSTKKRKDVIAQIDEKGRSAIDDLVHGLLNPDYVSDITFVTELTKIVLSYACNGKVVILGRGANFMTPFAQGLHVRITAPYAVRVQRAIDYEGLNYSMAKKVINQTESDRKNFVKQYLKKNIEDASSYDLTINTTYFDPEESADLVVKAFRSKFSRFKPFKKLLKQVK